jgi:preprotein translocase subunit SecG
MGSVITVFIILVCILLILVVLIQNSKGGGLSSQFAGSNQIMGVRRTADFLEKATYTLAITLLVLSLLSSANINKGGAVSESKESQGSETKAKASEMQPLKAAPAVQPSTNLNTTTPPPAKDAPKKH